MISQKEEMRTGTESSGVVLHDMIERIYFYFIIFSQKRNGKRETHGRRGSSCNGPAYSCCGGNWTKPSACVIVHGVGMTPAHLVWASSSDMPWYGPKPLDAMVDTEHVK